MQNIVINMCEKFHYDRLRNDRALGNGKSDNNNNNNNNVGSACGRVSGSKKRFVVWHTQLQRMITGSFDEGGS